MDGDDRNLLITQFGKGSHHGGIAEALFCFPFYCFCLFSSLTLRFARWLNYREFKPDSS